jgi:transposase
MTLLNLNPEEWEALETLATETIDARVPRRAQALLWLADGQTVQEVAARLRVTRQAFYKWVACFQQRHGLAMAARLAPGQPPGCPRTVQGSLSR